VPQGEHSLLELTVLVLTSVWLLSFFSTSFFPGFPFKDAFTDVLAVLIVLLIMFRLLMPLQHACMPASNLHACCFFVNRC
jgi:hypothetical protein